MTNVDVARRSYQAFGEGNMDAVLADLDPEIEWHQAQGLPHGGTYRGVDDVRRSIFEPLTADWWETFDAEPSEFLDAGEHVVVLGRYTGRARGTGKPLDVPYVHVWRFRDGKAVTFRQFLDTAGWNAALA